MLCLERISQVSRVVPHAIPRLPKQWRMTLNARSSCLRFQALVLGFELRALHMLGWCSYQLSHIPNPPTMEVLTRMLGRSVTFGGYG